MAAGDHRSEPDALTALTWELLKDNKMVQKYLASQETLAAGDHWPIPPHIQSVKPKSKKKKKAKKSKGKQNKDGEGADNGA
jgi:hypothetical protein